MSSATDFDTYVSQPSIENMIFQTGYATIPVFEKKNDIIREICHYHVLDRTRSVLEQFKGGLKLLGILKLIKKHPVAFAELFCYKQLNLSAACMNDLFQINYAPVSTSLRNVQEQVIMLWRDYLQDCEGTVLCSEFEGHTARHT